jgi:ketosteroid isomerase-like protein
MSAAENKRLVEAAFDDLARADPMRFVELFDDDMVWIIMGQSAWSRRFEGKDSINRDLAGPLFSLFATPYRNIPERVIADDDGNVVVLAKGETRTKTGNDYNNDYCFVMRMRRGKIVELREYMDTALAERALGATPPA